MATGNHKVEIQVGVRDLASGALRNIQRQVSGMSRTIGTSGSAFGAFSRGLDGSIRKLDAMATSMYRFNMYTSNLQRNLRNVGALSAIAVGGVAVHGANKAMDFSLETAKMQTRMEVGPKVRKDIENYILNELNREVMFTPTQIAGMATTLGQAGIDNTKDMKSMLKTTTYFAEAVDAVPDQAAEMIISAANGFKISMDKSSTITDKLTVAVNKSLLQVEEMPHALGQLSGRANMYGQSLDSSLVALMTARDQGMGAAQASQNLLHGLRQASYIGNEMAVMPRRRKYYEALGVDDSFFDMDKKQMKEYHEIIASLEKTMINKGFVNHKYKGQVKNMDQYQEFLQKHGGIAPDDFWDSKEAMPLIGRIFGASGMTPFMMGLQSQYEEVDPETGEKTGKKFYGSAAAKKRYEEVKNSEGAVDRAHGIMEEEARFQLNVLGGAWEATQIKFMDALLPGIKGTSEALTDWLMGGPEQPIHDPMKPRPIHDADNYKASGLDKFTGVYEEVAKNFKEQGNLMTGDIVKGIGDGIVAGIKIGSVYGPLKDQIGEAFGDLFTADWGSSLWTLPWHVIDNGVNFIKDVGKANTSLSDAISNLPENLQDPAELIAKLAQGGLILLATGAIVGVVRLAIQGLSVALKGAKLAKDLTTAIANWITGSVSDSKGLPTDITKTITANVVNVYGNAVNNMGAGGGKDGGKGGKGGPNAPVPIFNHKGEKMPPSGKNPSPNPLNPNPSVITDKYGNPYPSTLSPDKTTTTKPTGGGPLRNPLGGGGGRLLAGLGFLASPAIAVNAIGAPIAWDSASWIANKSNESLGIEEEGPIFNTSVTDMASTIAGDWIGLAKNINDKLLKQVEEKITPHIGSDANKKVNDKLKEEVDKFSMHFPNTELHAAPEKTYNRSSIMGFVEEFRAKQAKEIKVEPVIQNSFTPEFKPEFNPLFDPIINQEFHPLFEPIFNPVFEIPKISLPNLSEERKQLLNMLPKEESEIARKSMIDNINGVNNAITSGFNLANERLKNVRVDNALNVQFSPNINISGNIKEHFNPVITTSGTTASFNQPSARASGPTRAAEIDRKRYGPQLLQ